MAWKRNEKLLESSKKLSQTTMLAFGKGLVPWEACLAEPSNPDAIFEMCRRS